MTVNTLFFEAVSLAANGTPVAYPNVSFDSEGAYYKVNVMPTAAFPLGIADTNRQGGICQVSCMIRDGIGELAALAMAKTMLDSFGRGTVLSDGETTVRIDDPAWASAGLQTTTGWYMIPVSIPYYTIY